MAPISTTIQVDRCADIVVAYATDPTRFAVELARPVPGPCLEGGLPRIIPDGVIIPATFVQAKPSRPCPLHGVWTKVDGMAKGDSGI